MPYTYNIKLNVKDNIEKVKELLKNPELKDPEERKALYASIFAARMTGNVERNEKSTLKVKPSYEAYQRNYNSLMASKGFEEFIQHTNKNDPDALKNILTARRTHGGDAEDKFKEFLLKHEKTPSDVPTRWMPTAKDRIDHLRTKVESAHAGTDEAVKAWAEIICTRMAVEAVAGKSTNLDQNIDGKKLAKTPNLAENELFKQFVKESTELKGTLTSKSYGGAGQNLFKKYVCELDNIPDSAPEQFMPSAYDHAEAMREKIKANPDSSKRKLWFTELMATRDAVNAKRKTPSTLQVPLPKDKLKSEREKWSKCETFQNYLDENRVEANKAGAEGHGGLLQEKFRAYVANMDHIPEDVPESCFPIAYDRLENLRDKYKEADYFQKTDEEKLTLAAEILATRKCVNAKRSEPDSLKVPMDAKKFAESYKKWTESKAFRDYVTSTDPKIQLEIRDAVLAGHGGALDEKFREHMVSLDNLDGVPKEMAPNARVRTEALKEKIAKEFDAEPERKLALFAELLATRGAVEAERGESKTLDRDIDPELVKKEREKLLACKSFQDFLKDEKSQTALREAVNTKRSHGGLVEDQFKEYLLGLDHIPGDVPARLMPNGLERVEKLKEKLQDPELLKDENKEQRFKLCAELMATRIATGAIRKTPKSMDKPIDPEAMQKAWEKWSNCTTLQQYLDEEKQEAMGSITAKHTHGGEFGEKFYNYVKKQPVIGTDVPEEMLPNAAERIEALKEEIRDLENNIFADDEEKYTLYAQVLATRMAMNAKRDDLDTLKNTKIDPQAIADAAKELSEFQPFKDFVDDKEREARNSITARYTHGGDLEEKFKEYVAGLDELPEKIPARYIPTAYERIEALKKKISGINPTAENADELVSACAALLGARRSVGAKRKTPDSLKINVQTKEAKDFSDKLRNCKAFKDFVKKNPKLVKDITSAKHTHGGELEEKFKEYILKLDKIPEGVPKEYMPTALERCEALKKKINSSEYRSKTPDEKKGILKELIATRAAVNSIRGDKKSLEPTVDADKLNEIRKMLDESAAVDDFLLRGASLEDLKDLATTGHGGALDDKLKEDILRQTKQSGIIPKNVPKRFLPGEAEIQKALTEEIKSDMKGSIPAWFDRQKDGYMNKVACLMYLKKRQRDAQQGVELAPLTHEEMEKNVAALKASNAFQSMFQADGATRNVLLKIRDNRMSDIFTDFANRGGQFIQQPAQPALQNQLEQQNPQLNQGLQNQPQDQNQQQNLNQQQNPNLQQNQNALQNQNQPVIQVAPI